MRLHPLWTVILLLSSTCLAQTITRTFFSDKDCTDQIAIQVALIMSEEVNCTEILACTRYPDGTNYYIQTCPILPTSIVNTDYNYISQSNSETCRMPSGFIGGLPNTCINGYTNLATNDTVSVMFNECSEDGSFTLQMFEDPICTKQLSSKSVNASCSDINGLKSDYITAACASQSYNVPVANVPALSPIIQNVLSMKAPLTVEHDSAANVINITRVYMYNIILVVVYLWIGH